MKLVLGTVQFGLNYGINNKAGKPSRQNVFEILDRAWKLGVRELDTSDGYGDACQLIKAYHIERPYRFAIMSKFTKSPANTYRQHLDDSLDSLGASFLDGYYFHRFQDYMDYADQQEFSLLKREGKIKQLAVSLYTKEELALVLRRRNVDVIQLPFNLLDCDDEKMALMQEAKASGIKIYVRSVFLQGIFSLDLNHFPGHLSDLVSPIRALRALAQAHHMTIEQMAIAYAHAQPLIDQVVIGVDNEAQLAANIADAQKPMPQSLIEAIQSIKITNPALINPAQWESLKKNNLEVAHENH